MRQFRRRKKRGGGRRGRSLEGILNGALSGGCGGRPRRRRERWERRRKKLLFPRSLFPDDDHLNIPLNLSEAFSSSSSSFDSGRPRGWNIYLERESVKSLLLLHLLLLFPRRSRRRRRISYSAKGLLLLLLPLRLRLEKSSSYIFFPHSFLAGFG